MATPPIEEEIKEQDIIYNKPDTIDTTNTFIKPDTIDTPTYEKPNAYDDLTTPITPTPAEVDELAMNMENAAQIEAIHRIEEEDGEGPILDTIVRYKTRKAKMAPTKENNNKVTSSLLSKIQSATTITTTSTIVSDEDNNNESFINNSSTLLLSPTSIHQHHLNYSNSNLSVDSNGISPSISNSTIDSYSSTTSSNATSSKQMLLDSLKKRSSKDVLQYDIKKVSLVQPHHHDIFIGGTKKLIYRKRQPHSYSWGFQNILYKTLMDQHYENSDQYTKHGIKIAEARRRAFQKDITIEWGLDDDTNTNLINNDSQLDFIQDNEDDDIQSQGSHDTTNNNNTEKKPRCRKFLNVNNSHLLFIYETLYDTNYCLRWKRPSLVSHDMVCEIRRLDEDDYKEEDNNNNDKSNHHHKKKKKKWQLLAEFDSHGMGYLINVGKLTMDLRGLALVERPDHLESHLLITCCTLVDLMREVVQKAVGLSNGGVASSN